jgi:hypothetical protein
VGESALFAHCLEADVVPEPARPAWCYGDPGVAGALLVGARATGSAAWEDEALALGHGVAARPFEQTGIIDALLCHGASGVAHVLNQLYQPTS